MKGKFFLFPVLVCVCITACTKYERQGNVAKPGIALTFDDYSIDNWYRYLSLFDSFGAKATFYISSYHTLSSQQKSKLREMQLRGHEIGYHTTFHHNLCDYQKLYGTEDLMRYEIYQDLNKMNRDGFYPSTFAYPYGAHNATIDSSLLKIFKSVRALNGTEDLAKSVTQTTRNTVLYALGTDNKRRSSSTIEKMIDLANENHNCLVLVGHQIENPDAKFQVSAEKLRCILRKAKNLNMNFYRVSEISN